MDENKSKSKSPFSPLGVVIILSILALVAFVAVPNFIRARTTPAMNSCINNLRQIDAAKQMWALENNKADTNRVTWDDIKPYLARGATDAMDFIYCHMDATKNFSNSYTLEDLQTKPKCKINPAVHFIN